MPSRSSRLKITLKLPSQTQKPPHAPHTVHKDSDIESEDYDEDDHPHGRDGKRPLTTCQAVLASVVGSSPLTFRWVGSCSFNLSRLIIRSIDETSRKKKQLNEAEIALRREETARKRKHLSEKKLEDEKVRVCPILIFVSRSNVSYQAETINRLLKK
jgi:Ino eighty subunit 2